MKPRWKDAPDWAEYLIQNTNEIWYWFYNKPSPRQSFLYNTLEKRPKYIL